MFGVEAFPAAVFLVMLLSSLRGPRWLVTQALVDKARTVSEQVGTDTDNVEEGVVAIRRL